MLSKDQIKIFLEFVELRTKIASVVPMTAGVLWSIYRYQSFHLLNTIIFILAVLSFDMCTTAINNTMDYYKAKSNRYREEENVIGVYQLTPKKMVYLTVSLLVISMILSLILVFLTDPILLVLGAICFIIGILYTFGPLPISRTPYGEIFSGVTMGFGIFFLAIFIQQPENLIISYWDIATMQLNWQWLRTLEVVLMSLPFVCLIANIMLANNTCDLAMDIENERYTLVYYIGLKRAAYLYQLLSLLPWVFWLLYIILGLLPIWAILGMIAIYPYYQSVVRFSNRQVKRETFIESIKNFKLFAIIYLGILLLAIIIQSFI